MILIIKNKVFKLFSVHVRKFHYSPTPVILVLFGGDGGCTLFKIFNLWQLNRFLGFLWIIRFFFAYTLYNMIRFNIFIWPPFCITIIFKIFINTWSFLFTIRRRRWKYLFAGGGCIYSSNRWKYWKFPHHQLQLVHLQLVYIKFRMCKIILLKYWFFCLGIWLHFHH